MPETLSGHSGGVTATVTYTERNFSYDKLRLKITRSGRTAMDVPIQQAGCKDCQDFRPSLVRVRDLDGGEPEVLVDLYTLGAHCCSVTLILRWDPAAHRYRSNLEFWGNYGMKLADLDHDGLPELSAFDERFVYAYTAYVFSDAPPQIFALPAGQARRRHPEVPGQDQGERRLRAQAVRPPEEGADRLRPARVRRRLRRRPVPARPARPREEGARRRAREGDPVPGEGVPRDALRRRLRRTAEQGPAQVGLHHLSGIDALLEDARGRITRLTPAEAYAAWQDGALLVDTRTPDQLEDGAIPGAVQHALSVVLWRLDELPRETRVILICRHGESSSLAAAQLAQLGFPRRRRRDRRGRGLARGRATGSWPGRRRPDRLAAPRTAAWPPGSSASPRSGRRGTSPST